MASTGSAGSSGPGTRADRTVAARRHRRRRWVRTLARVVLVGVLAALVGTGTFVAGLLAAPIDFAVPPPPTSALLFAADGKTQFAAIRPAIRREVVPPGDIPAVMRQAIIAAEDERFLAHRGVDPLAVIRAAYRDLTGGHTQGGSTITQQYVKNVYVGDDRTALRKIKEAALAVRLEQKLAKAQILTDYLNVLYLGNGLYGVQAASRYYFGVDIKDLDVDRSRGNRHDANLGLARASLLAGIAPAPSAWNPVQDFASARGRQQYTLNQMIKLGFVSPDEASTAFGRTVTPVKEAPPELPTNAPEFTDLMKAQLKARFSGAQEEVLFQGGLRVRTTLDQDLQTAAARALREVLPNDSDPEGALVAVDIRNGDVKAMSTLLRRPAVGTTPAVTSYQRNGYNLATNAQRSTGSTIKPFTLAVALQQGHSLDEYRYAPQCARIPDAGVTAPVPGFYTPCNADVRESGMFTLRRALADSINTIYVPLAIEVGRSKVRDLMLQAGVKVAIADGKPRFSATDNSFGLGTSAEVTPLSLANAYATLVNHGVHTTPRFFTEIRSGGTAASDGRVLDGFSTPVRANRVLPAGIADQVTSAMQDVVDHGTGTAAQQPFPVYGKTGTTDDAGDAWFVGCARAPQYVCIATWMGYEDHRSMHDIGGQNGLIFGGTLPAKVFARTFEILREIQAGRPSALGSSPASAVPVVPGAPVVPSRRQRLSSPVPLQPPVQPSPAAPVPSPGQPVATQSSAPPLVPISPPVAGGSPPP
ncbi:MAG: pbpF 1 [Frankiales bacterium]|nr:pbpF 1 [Frankiales bacterium]